ncbi:MAG: rod-binding protein [Herbinix sp.]|nr:rod-binding protein [Herbinix sp.]
MSINIDPNSQYFMNGAMAADKSRESILEDKLQSKPTTDEELMEVCKSFETYLLEQVMKGMEKTIPSEDKKNPYLENFGDMLYQEYAKSATENQELGLAQMLYESMKRNSLYTK